MTESFAEDLSQIVASAIAPIGRETQRACKSYRMTDQAGAGGLTLGSDESLSYTLLRLAQPTLPKVKRVSLRIPA